MRKRRGKTRGFSIQKKRKNNPNGKLEVIIPPDRTVAVGPGASNFVTKLSVTIDQNAKHDVKTWKKVSDLAKERIVAHMLDAFEFQTRNTLGILSFIQKFATKEERLQNIPEDVTKVEWKLLVDYFNSDPFKRMSARNKINKTKQGINHICGRKSFGAISFEKDKVNELVAEQIQEIEEGTDDMDPIVNASFMKIVGEKSGYYRGQGSGLKLTNK
ncbi:uncharacterized protein [Nicotiana sylvestris]|uniref:uncharacterized protein isoform X1 n=1 Tax=Nicotiana sylvestris TaxID=4096 RepID=UPI00388C6A37